MSARIRQRRPFTLPSRSDAMSMYWIWSRPWWAVISDSLRVSVHLTGFPSRRATSRLMTSSGVTCSLPPKPLLHEPSADHDLGVGEDLVGVGPGAGLPAVEDEVEAAVGLEVVVGQLGALGD